MTLKLVLLAAVAYMLYRMVESEKRKKKEQEAQERQHRVDTGELVQDPTCGAYVETESSISVRDGDDVRYFCGYDCRDAFLRLREASREAVTAARQPEEDGETG